jgi:hypothetical protein
MTKGPDLQSSVHVSAATYPLLDALRGRRSRRFAKGASLDGGPLSYQSSQAPEPLTLDEEAALAFAAAGITGRTFAELPYERGANPESGGGNIIIHFVGRTVPSGDAMNSVVLFVLNDEGTWLLRRPQDFHGETLAAQITAGRDGRLAEAYEASRVRLSTRRAAIEHRVPFVPPFNLWDTNVAGSTYFVTVTDFTALYINVLLAAFSEELGYFIVDDHTGYRPAGLKRFGRSQGGHLYDDPDEGRVLTVGYLETALATITAAEEGAMHQNLALMTEALGLGGFTHAARHPAWLKALGFSTVPRRFSTITNRGMAARTMMRFMGWPDPIVDLPVGLQQGDSWLLRAFCPPSYASMSDAVTAFIDYKFNPDYGTLRAGETPSWHDGRALQSSIPGYSSEAIAATTAYCEYLFDRYGRFPARLLPFETALGYQAHHLDVEFYDTFYRPDALGPSQRGHRHEVDSTQRTGAPVHHSP